MFRKLFGISENTKNPQKEESILPWNPLVDLEQLDKIRKASEKRPQLIFKHSTGCGISRMVLKQFTQIFPKEIEVDLYYLDLLQYRTISNEVAQQFDVIHQSPQVLIIKNAQVIQDASHGQILEIDLFQ